MMDPTNVFRHSLWPRPGGPGEERSLGRDKVDGKSVRALMDGYGDEMLDDEGNGGAAVTNQHYERKGKKVAGLTESHLEGQGVYDQIPILKEMDDERF